MEVKFVGGTYGMDALSFDAQRSINMYPLISEVGSSKSVTALRSVAGLKEFAVVGQGPIRAVWESTSGRAYTLSGTEFYEVFTDGTSNKLGDINTFTSPVSLAENNDEIIIVDGQDGWLFTQSTDTFAQITDLDFPVTSFVTYQDGYFIVTEDGTQNFFISGINNGASWAALDQSTVESSPDNLTGVISDNGNVWFFGNRSVEVYQNTGDATFPFSRIPGAIVQTGCANGFTVQKFDNSIAWLGTDEQGGAVVWRANGYNAERISTQAIERLINSVSDFTDASAWVYQERGHIFYMLQIKGLDSTLCYDGSTGQWHERQFLDIVTNTEERHRGSCFMFFNNKNIVGDRETGQLFEMSLDLYSDNGTPLVKTRISPHYDDMKQYITHDSFEIDMEIGQGLTTGQGSDPQIMLQYSDDGGYTYGNEVWIPMGKKGEYKTRTIWRRLGIARDRVYKVSVSDPVFVQFNKAYINGS